MSELKDRVSKEIIAGMKAKDKTKLNVLRYVKKLFIENETSKKPISEIDIIISHAKKTRDSLELYPDGQQKDEIQAELKILADYLPKQLTEAEVVQFIDDIKSSLDKPNMGLIMKELSGKIKGQFDGKKATELVKASLA
jgi:uncharacterized protein YqeY